MMSELGDYTPISCDLYDQLEMLAMRKSSVSMRIQRDGNIQRIAGVIEKMETRKDGEFITLDYGTEIRLDQILDAQGMDS